MYGLYLCVPHRNHSVADLYHDTTNHADVNWGVFFPLHCKHYALLLSYRVYLGCMYDIEYIARFVLAFH